MTASSALGVVALLLSTPFSQSYSVIISKTDTTAYTLAGVKNDGTAITNGAVEVPTPTTGTTSNTYDLGAGCYYVETFTTAKSTAYSSPASWSWITTGTQPAKGYAYDDGTVGVGGMICGVPTCYDTCRKNLVGLSDTDECTNYALLLKECSACDGEDLVTMMQLATDATCAGPNPWENVDADGVPTERFTLVKTSHLSYIWHLTLLLQDTSVPDRDVPTSFRTQVVEALATFFNANPYSLFTLTKINGKAVADVMARRRLRGDVSDSNTVGTGEAVAERHGRALPATTTRSLTRLTFQLNAADKNQDDRFNELDTKADESQTALQGQLNSVVTLLRSAKLLSLHYKREIRTVIDTVTLETKNLGPTPAPTPAPSGPPTGKPVRAPSGLVEKPQESTGGSSSSGGGVSPAGKYAGLAVAGLVVLGIVYCCAGGAFRRRREGKAEKEKQLEQRKRDDEIFRHSQAAMATKIAVANQSSAPPTPIENPLRKGS